MYLTQVLQLIQGSPSVMAPGLGETSRAAPVGQPRPGLGTLCSCSDLASNCFGAFGKLLNLARPRSQHTGRGRAGEGGRRLSKARRGEGAGPALAGSRAREGEACVSARCVRLCGEIVRRSGARRWAPAHPLRVPPRARARAHPLALLSRSGRPPPSARPRKLFRAGASAGARLSAARARSCRSLPRCPWAAGVAGVEGVLFPLLTPLPSFCCGYWSSKKKGVAGGAAGCAGETRTSASRSPLPLFSARWPPHSRRPHSLKFPPLRFAFALKMAPESLHVRPFMFQSPGLSPPQPLFFPHSL